MKITTLFRSVALACAAIGTTSAAMAADGVSLTRSLQAYYEDATSSVGNYYIILADNEGAYYDTQEFDVKMPGEGYSLALDLYAGVSTVKPISFPGGEYLSGDGSKSMTYDSSTTILRKYDAKGAVIGEYSLSGSVNVTVTESGTYEIAASAMVDGKATPVTFAGSVTFHDPSHSYTWPQISENMDITFADAHAVYDGNLWESNTGEFYLYLYNDLAKRVVDSDGSVSFDMTTPGATRYAIMLFGRLFGENIDPFVEAGTYKAAQSMRRNTYYTGREIDYGGFTIPFGFYVQKRIPNVSADSNTALSYVESGDVEISIGADGNYDITMNCISTLGHTIKGTYHGPISVENQDPKTPPPVHISTLDDDVECDLDQIEVARLQYAGIAGDPVPCHQLVLDIGSPSGKDQAVVDNGGDIMRLWFLQSLDQPYLLEGTYTMTEYKWENYYAPYRMVWGQWSKEALGDLSYTRYMNFIPGRYMVMDDHAPMVAGSAAVVKNDDGDYTITFDFLDDLNFRVSGEWTGPVEYTYNPELYVQESGISSVVNDGREVALEPMTANRYFVRNLPAGAAVHVFATSGAAMPAVMTAEGILDLNGLNSGVYVVNVAGSSFKVTKQ